MKQDYNRIIKRLAGSMECPAPAWALPWETEKNKYPNTAHAVDSIESVLSAYYRHEHITFRELEQGNSYYSPADDMIVLPMRKQFKSTDAYYATKAHETIHSTGEYTRCNRDVFSEFKTFEFGDVRYSTEELIAEIGACFLLSTLGMDTSYAEQNATAYINHWIEHLNHNPIWIYRASEQALDAVEYIIESSER